MDADRILAVGLTGHDEADEHPLAGWVHTRATAHMLAWALDGTAPPALADHLGKAGRRGPVARSPHLSAPERTVFFDHLRNVSEHPDAAPSLLRRQSLYLASYDQAPDTAAWTALGLRHRTGRARGGSPEWAETRSVATALARLGDPQPLLTFIERGMHDDAAEAANLNYMALWHSALGTPQADDHFMLDQSLSGWDPLTLLRQLAIRVTPSPGFVDLHAHSLWALVEAYPWLPMAAPRLGPHLRSEVSRLLDGPGLSPRARRELAHIHYIFGTTR
ncbi:XRE family transcriptional regulator [Streptomyces sp. GZWMJZ-114]|uniref:XRE family transcriptional regulator n=1 Tax=Streptomyces sp. GZWMJZ-114 TaxID=2494734 RepID=UPI001F514BAE|nr:XRE family transcriptional regulator [Streptomyces sp. GZWMJZ-114]